MNSVLKIWSILMLITLSFHLVQAAEVDILPVTDDGQSISTLHRQIEELNMMQDSLTHIENTKGLMSAIGQTIDMAEKFLNENNQNPNEIKTQKLIGELASLISTFKAQDPLNQILGLHMSDELSF